MKEIKDKGEDCDLSLNNPPPHILQSCTSPTVPLNSGLSGPRHSQPESIQKKGDSLFKISTQILQAPAQRGQPSLPSPLTPPLSQSEGNGK